MEFVKIKNLTFFYPNDTTPVLDNVNLSFEKGSFNTIFGKSGSGKTTLLRHLKPSLSPSGTKTGEILLDGCDINNTTYKTQAEKIGYVMQNPDNQIVTDKVWHELAFGLESLGLENEEIRCKVAEMASFFGIEDWFYKNVSELSGGQKQLLALASIMVMQPSVLILDEPTSQLDPIAAQEFLGTIHKINKELGTTIIISEHRLEEAFPISDRIIYIENGRIKSDGDPSTVGEYIKNNATEMISALPTPMQVYSSVNCDYNCPVTIRDGRKWLEDITKNMEISPCGKPDDTTEKDFIISAKNVWFKYEQNGDDIIKGLDIDIAKGNIYAIVGGNGTGKSTMLSIITGINIPYRGKVLIDGLRAKEYSEANTGNICLLPQNPQLLFVKNTVMLDLLDTMEGCCVNYDDKKKAVLEISSLCGINNLLNRHPYDLSGGEQQRAALAKLLLMNPKILLLDEPTKGLDADFKIKLASILRALKSKGITVVIVSHDIEFCAKYADYCAMFFDGNIVSKGYPRTFFGGKSFYTTSANKMSRGIIDAAILPEDIIGAIGGKINNTPEYKAQEKLPEIENSKAEAHKAEKNGISKSNLLWGIGFLVLFVLTIIFFSKRWTDWRDVLIQFITILELAIAVSCFVQKKIHLRYESKNPQKRHIRRKNIITMLLSIIAVPATIYIGIHFFGDRKYYFISILILLEIILPFIISFERKKNTARELVIIAVICGIAVAGRIALYMLPQFKPMLAIVILAGICFGGETGFLVGALSAFVSNMFFGQGPWTPWQMLAFGIVGLVAGVLAQIGLIKKSRLSISIFGGISTVLIFGVIVNLSYVFMYSSPSVGAVISSCIMGLPFDLIHSAATVFFLWFTGETIMKKIDRIRTKYGITDNDN